MKQYELQQAIREITEGKMQEREEQALEDMMWGAIKDGSEGKRTRARAVIDFLYKAGKIELTEGFQLADLIG